MNVQVTKEMLEKDFDELTVEEEETLQSVLFDMFKYDLDYALYNNHIDLPIIDENGLTVEIEKIYDYATKDVRLSYDFNVEYGVLLSLCTDLDYAYYNSDIELWNTICNNDDLVNHDNVPNVYSESIFFLFSDVENAIYNSEEHLLSDDELSYFVDNYEYKDLIDTDELLSYLSLSINELDKWILAKLYDTEKQVEKLVSVESTYEPVSIYTPIYNDGGDTIYLYEQLDEDGIMEYIL